MKSMPSWSAKTASSTTFRMTRGCGSKVPSSATVTSPKVSRPSSSFLTTDPNLLNCQPIPRNLSRLWHPLRREPAARTSTSFGRPVRHQPGSAVGHLRWNLLGRHDTARPRACGADLPGLRDHGGPAVGRDAQPRSESPRLRDELHDTRDLLARAGHPDCSARAKQSELRLDSPRVLVRRNHGALLDIAAG